MKKEAMRTSRPTCRTCRPVAKPVPAWSRGRPAAAGLLAGAVWLAALPASAQLAREDAVMNRERPEYDPIGLLMPFGDLAVEGDTLLFPRLRLTSGWEDNVYRTEDDTTSDFFVEAAPELELRFDDEVNLLFLRTGAALRRYLNEDRNDFEDLEVAGGGTYEVTEGLRLRGEAAWARLHEDRSDPDSAGAASAVTEYDQVSGEAAVEYELSDLRFLLGSSARDLTFDDNGRVPGIFRDRFEYDTRLRAGYEFSPGVQVFVEPSYNWVRYDQERDEDGFLQDNEGWQVLAGLGYDVSGVSYAEIGVGYRSQSFEDDRFDDASGFAVDAEVIWNATDQLTLSLGAGRSVSQTTIAGASASTDTSVSLGLDYEIRYDLLLNSGVRYTSSTFEDTDRDDDDLGARVGLIYLINEYASAELAYELEVRDSSAPDADFTSNTVTLGVGLQY